MRNNGNADLTSLKNAYLERNGVKVSTDVTSNGKDLTFAVANNSITDSQTATYYVRGTVDYVDNASGDTYNFVLRNTSDISAVEANNTAIRVQVTSAPITLANYVVNGGDLKFTKDPSFVVTATYSAGTPSVVFMSGTVTAKEAITLEDATLSYNASTGVQKIAKRFYLSIGGSTFSWTPSASAPAIGNALFDGAVVINGTVPVKLWADLDVNAPAGSTLAFGALNSSVFALKEYVSTQNVVTSSIGTIQSATVNVVASKVSVSRSDNLASTTNIVFNSTDKLVYGVTLNNNQDNSIRVNSLNLINSSGAFNNGIDLTLYVNGVATSTKRYNGGVTFDSLNTTVVKGTPVQFTVRADLVGVATGTAGAFAIASIDSIDTVTSNAAVVSGLPATGSTIKIVDAGQANVAKDSNSAASTLFFGGQTATEVGSFNIESRNDSSKLTDIYLTTVSGLNLSKLGAIYLTDGTTNYAGTKDGAYIKFEGMSVAIAQNATKKFTVKADVANVTDAADLTNSTFQLVVATGFNVAMGATAGTINGIRLISDANGQAITNLTVTNPISNVQTIVASFPFFSNPTTDQTTVIKFDVTPKGGKIRLQSISYTSAGSAFTGTIQLRDSNTNLIISTGTVSAAGTLSFAGGVEVSSPTSFKVVAPNYTAGQNDTKRSFTITDVSYDQWTSADGVYTNVPSVTSYMNAVGLTTPSAATFSTLY